MDNYTTGNQERDKLLVAAIEKVIAAGKTPSMKLVARQLPDDFMLDAEELEGMTPAADKPPLENIEQSRPLEAAPPEPPTNDAAETTPQPEIGEREARAILDNANARLRSARGDMAIATEKLKQLRGDLAKAIYDWQLCEPTPKQQKFENLIRETIAANQKLKQDIKDGIVPPPQRGGPKGRSYIDRSRGFYGDGNDFARRSTQTTPSLGGAQVVKGHSRGAYSKTDAMRIEAAKLRAAAQARKLPSER